MVTSRVEVPATSWDYEKGEISKIATIPKKNIVFCLYIKEKHYFCRVIKKNREYKYEVIYLCILLLFLLLL